MFAADLPARASHEEDFDSYSCEYVELFPSGVGSRMSSRMSIWWAWISAKSRRARIGGHGRPVLCSRHTLDSDYGGGGFGGQRRESDLRRRASRVLTSSFGKVLGTIRLSQWRSVPDSCDIVPPLADDVHQCFNTYCEKRPLSLSTFLG